MPSGMLSGEEAIFATSPESGHIDIFISPWKTGAMLFGLIKHISATVPLIKHMLPERQAKNKIAHPSSNGEGRIIPECSGIVLQGLGYRQRILPDALGFIGSLPTNNGLAILMHDNASVHTAAPAREYLEANGVVPMAWPPFSPDLNPIENVWGLMKTYMKEHHGDFIGTR
ncbi:hypothetical protein K3495_g16845 [Podosphaera aphanis]|nr:hypothetical protein K3495_g16845 [Podosphaera aphanis]